jgi:hypothetical protein
MHSLNDPEVMAGSAQDKINKSGWWMHKQGTKSGR